MRFQDRAVLVTGGGSGIGQQVCYAAAKEGGRVAVGDLDLERAETTAAEIRKRGGEAQAFRLDVAEPASANAFVEAAETTLGRLDVLVNSAGIREIVPVARPVLRGMAAGHHRQPDRHLPAEPGLRAPAGGAGQAGADRQPGLDARADGGAEPRGLHRLEARRRRADQADGAGARREGHPRQRGGARRGAHAADRALLPGPGVLRR